MANGPITAAVIQDLAPRASDVSAFTWNCPNDSEKSTFFIATFGASRIVFAAGQLPARIEQAGWVVDYADWKADAVSGLPMPGRINAQRGEDRVRLVVDRWDASLE